MSTGYELAVRSWTEHLRRGGTTTWPQWVTLAGAATAPVPTRESLPGAAQLELVRRMALVAAPAGEGFTALADRVLDRSAPGRGGPDRPLSWPAAPPPGYGPPPIDPAEVPDRELLRLAVGVLVDLVLTRPQGRRREPRPRWRTGEPFRLDGTPVGCASVRAGLAAAGHLERLGADRVDQVVLLGAPVDDMLAQVWSARVQHGASARWHGFLHRWSGRSRLPGSVDLAATAARWAERVGAEHVHVVVGDGRADHALQTVADVLALRAPRGRRRRAVRLPSGPLALSPAEADVVRRVNAVLAVRVGTDRHRAVQPRVVAAVHDPARPGGSLTVPAGLREWTRGQGERLAEELSTGRYRVHGDVAGLLPRLEGPSRPPQGEALEVAVAACLTESADGPEGGQ